MNNLTIGGADDRGGTRRQFAYYETIAGGMGARPTKDGVSAVHTHMTNSLNTPAEALEHAYPIRVIEYAIRKGSGGRGKYRGGDGIVREIELLSDAQVTLLADRRSRGPYGLHGGSDGAAGKTEVLRVAGRSRGLGFGCLPGKCSVQLKRGDRVRISTSGGGGWGRK
jgi:N-methylhydantoinase B